GVAAIGLLFVALLTATTANAQSADLAITVTDSPDPVPAGGTLTYTITITNNGPDAATNPVVSLMTPPETVFSSVACPMGWVAAPVGTARKDATCSTANLPAGSIATVQFSVKVNGDLPKGVTIFYVAAISSATIDPSTGNNVVSTTTTVDPGFTNTV